MESVPTDSLVDLHVFQQVGFLAEGLGAGVAFERFFSRVRPQVDFDVGFVEESAVADVAPVDGFLLAVAVRCHDCRHFTFGRAAVLVFRLAGRTSAAVGRHHSAQLIFEIAQVFASAAGAEVAAGSVLSGRAASGEAARVAAVVAQVRKRRGHVIQVGTRVERGVRKLLLQLFTGTGHGTRHEVVAGRHGSAASGRSAHSGIVASGRQPPLQQRHVHGRLALDGHRLVARIVGHAPRVLGHVSQGHAPRRGPALRQQRLQSGTDAAAAVVSLLLLR